MALGGGQGRRASQDRVSVTQRLLFKDIKPITAKASKRAYISPAMGEQTAQVAENALHSLAGWMYPMPEADLACVWCSPYRPVSAIVARAL